jgi:hypothetical protein
MHSKGFYLAFLDSDDIWFKNKLKVYKSFIMKEFKNLTLLLLSEITGATSAKTRT